MNRWKSGVSKLVLAFIVVVSFFSFQSSTHAAAIGGKLDLPESEWTRYDDNSPSLIYSGGWGKSPNQGHYGGYLAYAGVASSSVSFKFYGTQLRVIGANHPTHSQTIAITIDGVTEVFSQKGPETYRVLQFEKLGLSQGIHEVEMHSIATSGYGLRLDAIDIDKTGYLINPNLNENLNLTAVGGQSQVSLNWKSISGATSYNVKRAITTGGPYTSIASSVTGTTYTDTNVTSANGITYYYVVTAVNAGGESGYSNEASAKPLAPVTGRAILTIYLTNGAEKEYDLSITEVDAFIDWYDKKHTGIGPSKYAFNKTWNIGPFSKRTEYVIFDKILTFNVDEYTTEK